MTFGGLVFVFLSFFESFPVPSNGWSPILRGETNIGLFGTGMLFLLGGIGLWVLTNYASGNLFHSSEADLLESDSFLEDRPESSIASNFEHNESSEESVTKKKYKDPEDHPMVQKWWRLSSTQKEIVLFIYEHSHRDNILFDKLYDAFCKRYSEEPVPSSDEMYFRVRALETEGFIVLTGIAEKATNIEKIPEVRKALSEGDVIVTRG